MNNRDLLRGLLLMVIALFFGLQSLRYPLGRIDSAGPGMFPLMISCFLFILALATLIGTFFSERTPLFFSLKNIGLIIGSLVAFALVSEFVNMIVGIIVMVFMASLAGASYSWIRNLQIAAGLVAIAVAFQKLLGLQLPLY